MVTDYVGRPTIVGLAHSLRKPCGGLELYSITVDYIGDNVFFEGKAGLI